MAPQLFPYYHVLRVLCTNVVLGRQRIQHTPPRESTIYTLGCAVMRTRVRTCANVHNPRPSLRAEAAHQGAHAEQEHALYPHLPKLNMWSPSPVLLFAWWHGMAGKQTHALNVFRLCGYRDTSWLVDHDMPVTTWL